MTIFFDAETNVSFCTFCDVLFGSQCIKISRCVAALPIQRTGIVILFFVAETNMTFCILCDVLLGSQPIEISRRVVASPPFLKRPVQTLPTFLQRPMLVLPPFSNAKTIATPCTIIAAVHQQHFSPEAHSETISERSIIFMQASLVYSTAPLEERVVEQNNLTKKIVVVATKARNVNGVKKNKYFKKGIQSPQCGRYI